MNVGVISNAYSIKTPQKLYKDPSSQMPTPSFPPGPDSQYTFPGDYLAPQGVGSTPIPPTPTPGALTANEVYRQYSRVVPVGKVLNFRQNDMFQQKYTAWKDRIAQAAGVKPYDPPNLRATGDYCNSVAVQDYIHMQPLAPTSTELAAALVHDVGLPPTKYIADESKGFLQKPTCIQYAIPQLHSIGS